MSFYTEPGDWVEHVAGIDYRAKLPLIWEVGRKGSGLFFTIPRGRIFDVSVPRLLRWLFSPHDPRFLKAAALHDEMLKDGWSRLSAGAEFAEALKADQVSSRERMAMWLSVSLLNWS